MIPCISCKVKTLDAFYLSRSDKVRGTPDHPASPSSHIVGCWLENLVYAWLTLLAGACST